MSTPILHARNLTKIIGKRTIVDALTFDVRSGEIFGFLGPNGAGKTTTIRMLVGLIRPTSGTVTICGHDSTSHPEQALRHVGCIVETPDLYKFMTGRENLEHFARMSGPLDRDEIERVAEITMLSHRLDDKVRTYSLGMRQRLGISIALLDDPKLLILDEPANGLDPAGIREMRGLLVRLAREQNVAVFVSSHLLAEIEMICDRVAIIHHGKMTKSGSVEEMIASRAEMEFRVDRPDEAAEIIRSLGFAARAQDHSVSSPVRVDEAAPIIAALARAGLELSEARSVLPTLEELFMEVTSGESVD